MKIYMLLHPTAGFAGYVGAVDFSNGRGSTSSLTDAVKLLELGRGFKLLASGPEEKAEVIKFRAERRLWRAQRAAESAASDALSRTPEGAQRLWEKKQERDAAEAARKPRVRKIHYR